MTRINGFKERDQVPGLDMVQFKIETDDCEVIVCYCFSELGLRQWLALCIGADSDLERERERETC